MAREKQGKFERTIDRKGEHRWHLKAPNGRIIAESGEGYTRKADLERAITTVIATAVAIDHARRMKRLRREGKIDATVELPAHTRPQ